jgi:hypothetical protein
MKHKNRKNSLYLIRNTFRRHMHITGCSKFSFHKAQKRFIWLREREWMSWEWAAQEQKMGENDPPDTWLSPVSSKRVNKSQYRVDKKRAVKRCKQTDHMYSWAYIHASGENLKTPVRLYTWQSEHRNGEALCVGVIAKSKVWVWNGSIQKGSIQNSLKYIKMPYDRSQKRK